MLSFLESMILMQVEVKASLNVTSENYPENGGHDKKRPNKPLYS